MPIIIGYWSVTSFKPLNSVSIENSYVTPVADSLKYPGFKFSTRLTIFFKELFASNISSENKKWQMDSSLVQNITPLVPPIISDLKIKPKFDDTLSLYYKKYKRRKNKTRGKRKKIWIDRDFLSYVKDYISGDNVDSLYSLAPIYQSHFVDLDYYMSNFFDSLNYKTEIEWAAIQKVDPEPFFKKKILYTLTTILQEK